MRRSPRFLHYPQFALALLLFASCGDAPAHTFATILEYNVQNLFDDVDDGDEYAEFTSAAGWTRQRYYDRLERLAATIRSVSRGGAPDAIVLTEIERDRVVRDLTHDLLRRFRHAVIAPHETNTQVAVLLRSQPSSVRAHHAMEIDVVPAPRPRAPRVTWRGRDILDVSLERPRLRILAAHFKSQSGGERDTEPKRIVEASLVNTVVSRDASNVALLVGDLNEDLDEFASHGGVWPTALVPADTTNGSAGARDLGQARSAGQRGTPIRFIRPDATQAQFVRSDAAERSTDAGRATESLEWSGPLWTTGWNPESGEGSYAFRGEWERLDHAFLAGSADLLPSVRVFADESLVDDAGYPARYDPRTGRGCSDHFPVVITLSTRRDR